MLTSLQPRFRAISHVSNVTSLALRRNDELVDTKAPRPHIDWEKRSGITEAHLSPRSFSAEDILSTLSGRMSQVPTNSTPVTALIEAAVLSMVIVSGLSL